MKRKEKVKGSSPKKHQVLALAVVLANVLANVLAVVSNFLAISSADLTPSSRLNHPWSVITQITLLGSAGLVRYKTVSIPYFSNLANTNR